MEQATKDKLTSKGGRPIGAKNKEHFCIVTWGWTQNQFREEWDEIDDEIKQIEVDDEEKKTYRERVRKSLVSQDNGVMWMVKRNEKLAKAGKKNRVRILDIKDELDPQSDVIATESDGIRAAIRDAGVLNG